MEAIVLAGGLGTRLRSVVKDQPKCMVPVVNRPFLEYVLDELIAGKVSRTILSVGYLKDSIISYFGNNYRGMEIGYATEEVPLGTGGGIRLAFEKINSESAYVFNGDTLFRVRLDIMARLHREKQAGITLALRHLTDISRYGSVMLDDENRITGFLEKQKARGDGYINGGIYLIDKGFLNSFDLPEKFSMEKDFFEKIYTGGKMYGYPSQEYFIDIGVPEDYQRAQKELNVEGQG